MITNEREWLRDQQPRNVTLHEETTDRARAALRAHLTAGPQRSLMRPLRASPTRPERRSLARAGKAAGALASLGAIGAAVAAVLSGPAATSQRPVAPGSASTGRGPFVTVRPGHRHGPSLLRVADHLRAETETVGNATLVIRTQSYPGKAPIVGADLYTDSGEYFFAHDKSGLGAQITAGDNQADGLFAREVAAAKAAATTNDINGARARMADAPDPAKPIPPGTTTVPKLKGGDGVVSRFDNYLWGDSLDALQAGAGDPQVRAGVLRLVATMNDVTVAQTTTDGQPTLTLTAGGPVFGFDGYQEQIIINADSGVPVSFIGGDPRHPSVTVTYGVTRVSTGDLTHNG
jgi:hypothetical protein